MYKKILFIFLCFNFIFVNAHAIEESKEVAQKALQETANAYYQRQGNILYGTYLYDFSYSPEEATSQDTYYTVCSVFTYHVYHEVFGINIPFATADYLSYAKNKTSNSEVVLYSEDTTLQDAVTANNIKFEIGDIVVYKDSGLIGHAIFVSDVDTNGNITQIYESTYYDSTDKIYSRASLINGEFNSLYALFKPSTYRDETMGVGTVLKRSGDRITSLMTTEREQISVFRFLNLYDETTNKIIYTDNTYSIPQYQGDTTTAKSYSITDSALQRVNYSKIYIEKTVDKLDENNVSLGDELTYKIVIKNNSDTAYSSFEVEEFTTDIVEITDSANGELTDMTTYHVYGIDSNSGDINKSIKWTINSLAAGETKTITYKVKVINDDSNIGKKVVSTGTVAGISSGTVENTIGKSLSTKDAKKIADNIDNISKENYGLDYINSIYKTNFNIDLNLSSSDFTLGGNVEYGSCTNDYLICYQNEPSDLLKYSYVTNLVKLTEYKDLSQMVYHNYYGAVRTYNNEKSILLNRRNYISALSKAAVRSDREDTIYTNSFSTGDILIYQSVNDFVDVDNNRKYFCNKPITTTESTAAYSTKINSYVSTSAAGCGEGNYDNGLYAFVYIEGKGFVGNNQGNDLENNYDDINFFDISDYSIAETLLTKDYYVVLRPSLVYDITEETSNSSDNETKENPKTGYTINIICTALTLTLIIGYIVYLKKKSPIQKI